jgi:hypothetical protein
VDATYPIGDDIIGYDQGFAITVEEEAHVPFYSSELRFLRQVKANPLHIVFNINGGHEGYIGESTSVETAYAMLLNKPIILLRSPEFSVTVPEPIKRIMKPRLESLIIAPLDTYGHSSIYDFLISIMSSKYDYELTEEEKSNLMSEIVKLCRKYLMSWNNYKGQGS